MATVHDIAAYDLVELTEQVEHVPAGARAGVMEVRHGDHVMLEVMEPDLGALDRVVFAPVAKLRVIERRSRS